MRLYATISDVTASLGVAPGNAESQIELASLLVESATKLSNYDVDEHGMPTDPVVIDAFRSATVRQLAFWKSNNIDPDKGHIGQDLRISSQSAGGGSVSYEGVASNEDIKAALDTLCDQSMLILQHAGLTKNRVMLYR